MQRDAILWMQESKYDTKENDRVLKRCHSNISTLYDKNNNEIYNIKKKLKKKSKKLSQSKS
jgi:hypothetical protein